MSDANKILFYRIRDEADNRTALVSQEEYSGSTLWYCINASLILVTVMGNLLTIGAISCSRKLSSVIANQFVFSLAVSDLMVGLTIPYHMAFYAVRDFGTGKTNCLLRFVLISFGCSSSISNLLVIAADRYVAIVYPLHYNRIITRKSAVLLTVFAWTLSFSIAAIPLIWNDWVEGKKCEMFEVIPPDYMNFVVCPMFVLIWVMMLLLYSRICREAAGHAKRIRNANSVQSMLTLRDSKSFQVMLTILGCFTVCWLPYFVIAIYSRHNREPKSILYYEIVFNMAVANSGMNPIIYAWKNQNFRASFSQLIRCRSPNAHPSAQYITDHVPSKKGSISNGGAAACNATIDIGDEELRDKIEMAAQKVQSTTRGEKKKEQGNEEKTTKKKGMDQAGVERA